MDYGKNQSDIFENTIEVCSFFIDQNRWCLNIYSENNSENFSVSSHFLWFFSLKSQNDWKHKATRWSKPQKKWKEKYAQIAQKSVWFFEFFLGPFYLQQMVRLWVQLMDSAASLIGMYSPKMFHLCSFICFFPLPIYHLYNVMLLPIITADNYLSLLSYLVSSSSSSSSPHVQIVE